MSMQVVSHSYQTLTANDIKYDILAAGVTAGGAALGYGVYKKPDLAIKGFEKVAGFLGKVGAKLSGAKYAKLSKIGAGIEKYAAKAIEKLPKYGKAGALAAVGLLTLGGLTRVISKHSYNEGKIDQKYIDQAKLENMTNSVIV